MAISWRLRYERASCPMPFRHRQALSFLGQCFAHLAPVQLSDTEKFILCLRGQDKLVEFRLKRLPSRFCEF
jgi:hypothetical protein